MEQIEERICDFEAAMDCTITLHDFVGAFRLGGPRYSHRKTFAVCRGEDREYCIGRCMFALNRRIEASGRRCYLTHCRNRRMEVVAPLYRGGIQVAAVFAGLWRAPLDREKVRAITSLLPLWAEGLLRYAEELREHEAGERGGFRRRVENFLARNYRNPVTLSMLAAECSLSEFRVSHLVTETFGRSFRELLLEERLRHARLYLANGDYRVGEVARLCGFGTPEHFSRTYKKATGSSPSKK